MFVRVVILIGIGTLGLDVVGGRPGENAHREETYESNRSERKLTVVLKLKSAISTSNVLFFASLISAFRGGVLSVLSL